MEYVKPEQSTVIFIAVFVLAYITFLLAKIKKNHVDVYDFLFLSLVSLIPAFFVLFPETCFEISAAIGVHFPFIILFGLLIFFIFLQLHRVAIAAYQVKTKMIRMNQKICFLENDLKEIKSKLNA